LKNEQVPKIKLHRDVRVVVAGRCLLTLLPLVALAACGRRAVSGGVGTAVGAAVGPGSDLDNLSGAPSAVYLTI